MRGGGKGPSEGLAAKHCDRGPLWAKQYTGTRTRSVVEQSSDSSLVAQLDSSPRIEVLVGCGIRHLLDSHGAFGT